MAQAIQEYLSDSGLYLKSNSGLSNSKNDFALEIEQIPLYYQAFNNTPSSSLGFLNIIPNFIFEK